MNMRPDSFAPGTSGTFGMEKNCFVCDRPNADQWLPELDVRFCSDECMELFMREYVQSRDPLKAKHEDTESGAEQTVSSQ